MQNIATSDVTVGNYFDFNDWLRTLGRHRVTGWRLRKRGWIRTTNICGRVYVSREEIQRFESRAAAGEFAQVHQAPRRAA